MKKILSILAVAMAFGATAATTFAVNDPRIVPDAGASLTLMAIASAGVFGLRSYLKRK